MRLAQLVCAALCAIAHALSDDDHAELNSAREELSAITRVLSSARRALEVSSPVSEHAAKELEEEVAKEAEEDTEEEPEEDTEDEAEEEAEEEAAATPELDGAVDEEPTPFDPTVARLSAKYGDLRV